jgi:ribosomal protein L40E
MISFVGDGSGINQPLNRYLQIQATVFNSGNIASANVEVMMYLGNDLIGYDIVATPAAGSVVAVDDEWVPTTVGSKIILVCADFNNTIPETDENNNCLSAGLSPFAWPDLDISTADILFTTEPVENTTGDVVVSVRNLGTGFAVDVDVMFSDDEGWSQTVVIEEILAGATGYATAQWTPQTAGTHNFTVIVDASNIALSQTDYDQSNNYANGSILVLTLPDLQVEMVCGYDNTLSTPIVPIVCQDFEVTVGVSYDIYVKINNTGGSNARNVTVELLLDDSETVSQVSGRNVTAGNSIEIVMNCDPILDIDSHRIDAIIDRDMIVPESDEGNNVGTFDFEVVPPSAYVSISTPEEGQTIKSGKVITVDGWVKEYTTERGIEGVELVVTLELVVEGADDTPVGSESYITSQTFGRVFGFFTLPDIDCEETYNLVVASNQSFVTEAYVGLSPAECIEETPLWVWLLILIIIIVVVIVIAITAYIKVFGLGKLVECGECGAFIPEDSTSCPKCGVQFETETAKCSSCQAWIPVKVKKCPECGVEFATGEVEMEDYKAKMRMQYDEVKTKLKKEAEGELGKALSDTEFEDWWKTQPTFVTFGDWLKQEEDMRKMGSKPCPSCGTLNSVTATVCHKCGALMKKEEKARRPPSTPPAEKPKPQEAVVPARKEAVTPGKPGERPPAAGAPPVAGVKPVAKKTLPTVERPVPKKVIKKPVVEGAPTVVPKKVVRKPEEEEEGEDNY